MTRTKLPRDFNVVSTFGRKTSFKDKRGGRGGNRNTQQELLEEYEDSKSEERNEDEES